MLSFIRAITHSLSTLGKLLSLYLTLDSPKLQYASTVWNSLTSDDVKKLESIQRKLVALCQCRFTSLDRTSYEDYPKLVKLHTLYNGRLHIDEPLLISVY